MLGQPDVHIFFNLKLYPYLTQYAKINSQCILSINLGVKTGKFLEDNIKEYLYKLRVGTLIKHNKNTNHKEKWSLQKIDIKIKIHFSSLRE